MRTLLFSMLMLGTLSVQAQWWSITGNASTNPPTNFMGTTDNIDIVFKRNNIRCGFLGTTNTSFGLVTNNTGNVGTNNSSFGVDALKFTTTGSSNTAIGYGTIANNPTGSNNTAVGTGALSFGPFIPANNTGSNNTGVGYAAGVFLITGSNNTLLGYAAGNGITNGSNNIIVGGASGGGLSTGSNNTIIGSNITGLSSTLTNNIILADGSGNQRILVNASGVIKLPSLAGSGTRTLVVDASGNVSALAGGGSPTLSFTSPNLSISGGNTVNLSALKDNMGNHVATTILNMNGNSISAADGITFSAGGQLISTFGFVYSAQAFGVAGSPTGLYDLEVFGTTKCTSGSWSASDFRYKKEIKPIQSALANILKLQGTSYYFKQDEFKDLHFDENLHYGLIAQELEKVYPDMVKTDAEGYKAVSYDMLIPVIIEGLKEQQDIINQQNERISNLESAINNNTENVSFSSGPAILYQNNPNPFDQRTLIKCIIPENVSNAQLRFYDLSGNLIETKVVPGTGEQTITVEGSSYINSIYVYSLYINDTLVDSKKMVVNK